MRTHCFLFLTVQFSCIHYIYTVRAHFLLYIYVHSLLGTGKSETGAHLAYAFARQNKVAVTSSKQCVLYCGPSNKAVNVVLGKQTSIRRVPIPIPIGTLGSFNKVSYFNARL